MVRGNWFGPRKVSDIGGITGGMEAIARIPYKRVQQFTPADSVNAAAELFVDNINANSILKEAVFVTVKGMITVPGNSHSSL